MREAGVGGGWSCNKRLRTERDKYGGEGVVDWYYCNLLVAVAVFRKAEGTAVKGRRGDN